MSVYVDSEKSVFSQLLNKLGVGAACLPWDLGGVVLVFFKAVHNTTGSAETTPSLSIKDCCWCCCASINTMRKWPIEIVHGLNQSNLLKVIDKKTGRKERDGSKLQSSQTTFTRGRG